MGTPEKTGVCWANRCKNECKICRKERETRWRVLGSRARAKLSEKKFKDTVAIVANNDVKYDLNKRRAQQWAREHKEAVCWCPAKDGVSLEALTEDPALPEKKKEWLQHHDKECGGLYGMLPLVKGLPVMLTDHVDRNPQKNLLRGRKGVIHSWIYADDEEPTRTGTDVIVRKLPSVIYVYFKDAKWAPLGGPKTKGLYPIVPVKKTWYLDKNRPVPKLKITRRQSPLAPAFACTAHFAQGKTLETAIVDLCIGEDASPLTGYVALSRVRNRNDIWIYRAFPASVFQRKPLFGPDLLLRHLRGEKIDWEELKGHCHKKRKALPQESDSDEEVGKCRRRESAPRSKRAMFGKQGKEHSEAISEGDAWEQMCQSRRSSKNRLSLHVSKTRRQKPRPAQKFGIAGDTAQAMTLQCHGCEERKLLQAFSRVQRATADSARCKNCCQDKKVASQIVLVCAACKAPKNRAALHKSRSDGDFLCADCRTRRRCYSCDAWKGYADFRRQAWRSRHRRTCLACETQAPQPKAL